MMVNAFRWLVFFFPCIGIADSAINVVDPNNTLPCKQLQVVITNKGHSQWTAVNSGVVFDPNSSGTASAVLLSSPGDIASIPPGHSVTITSKNDGTAALQETISYQNSDGLALGISATRGVLTPVLWPQAYLTASASGSLTNSASRLYVAGAGSHASTCYQNGNYTPGQVSFVINDPKGMTTAVSVKFKDVLSFQAAEKAAYDMLDPEYTSSLYQYAGKPLSVSADSDTKTVTYKFTQPCSNSACYY